MFRKMKTPYLAMAALVSCSAANSTFCDTKVKGSQLSGGYGSVYFREFPVNPFDEDPPRTFGFQISLHDDRPIEQAVEKIDEEIRSKLFRSILTGECITDLESGFDVGTGASLVFEETIDEPAEYQFGITIDADLHKSNPGLAERIYYYVVQRLFGFSQGLCFAGLRPGSSNIFLGIPDEAVFRTEVGYIIQDIDFHITCNRVGDGPRDSWSLQKRDNHELDHDFKGLLYKTYDKLDERYRQRGIAPQRGWLTMDHISHRRERDQTVARMLSRRHGIDWRSPSDLNRLGESWVNPRALLYLDDVGEKEDSN